MRQKTLYAVGLALALLSTQAGAEQMTAAQRADSIGKAETAARLVAYGRASKDPTLLRAAATLLTEAGPVASSVKDGKPVNYDVSELLKEADSYGQPRALDLSKQSATVCSWFYNCDSYNNCFWDQWC